MQERKVYGFMREYRKQTTRAGERRKRNDRRLRNRRLVRASLALALSLLILWVVILSVKQGDPSMQDESGAENTDFLSLIGEDIKFSEDGGQKDAWDGQKDVEGAEDAWGERQEAWGDQKNIGAGQKSAWDDSTMRFSIDLDHLYSPYAVLLDRVSGEILAERGSGERIYPASMTKIMTVILAIENTEDLNEKVVVPRDIFEKLYEENASLAGFLPGETVRKKDLLYGAMLPSGAECCIALADLIDGSEEGFADRMNEKAEELGLEQTHFQNSTGLHDPEHYSSVGDIAALLRYALKNETFYEIFTSSRYSMPPSDLHPDGVTFYSTLSESLESAEVTGGRILGGKTGYTDEAGLCLASLAEVGGREYILVTAKADGTHWTEPYHILDAVEVYTRIGERDLISR